MSILKHIVWLIVTAFFISSCATYSRKETECNLAKTEVNPVWDTEKLDEAFQFACDMGTNNLIVVTNGEIVKSMGELDKPLRLHSARKALLSAIVGQHVGTGPNQINLESTLAELGINDKPIPLTPLQQQAKVLHLIKSTSGINHPAAAEGGLMERDKNKRLGQKPNPPGIVWAFPACRTCRGRCRPENRPHFYVKTFVRWWVQQCDTGLDNPLFWADHAVVS